ncbi:MAG TPA: hypothetical protein VIF57_09990 [Polyangia bacterium]|jgi:hypothetical protein
MSHHPRTPSSSIATTVAVAAVAFTGCGLFIHSTPISKLPDQDREVIAQSGGKPNAVRLTRPAKVAGFDVAAGSVVQADGQDFRLQTAEPLTVKGVLLPARSSIELKKDVSIVTGDVYNWNGVVHLGGPLGSGSFEAQAGDRAYFETTTLWSNMKLTQVRLSTPREIGGRMLPAGSIVDLRDDGQIKESFTPGEQQQLAHDREVRRQERIRQEQRCKEVCAPVTDFAANARCLNNCRS